jgi:pyruvate-formate lyase
MLPEERRNGIYDVDPATPASITAHGPGYLDRDAELIVGLQTDAPLRRAIMPAGGLRMVRSGLAAYGYQLDPTVEQTFSRYRKTHNDAVSKYSELGIRFPLADTEPPSAALLQRVRGQFAATGLLVV